MLNTLEQYFEEVKTTEQIEEFNRFWKEICTDEHARYYPKHDSTEAYFLKDEEGNRVGTIGLQPRNPENYSMIEEFFDFENHNKVSKNHQEIYEIGRLSVRKEFRGGPHLANVLILILMHSRANGVKQYIATINAKLYRSLVLSYGLRLEKIGEGHQEGNLTLVPVLVDVEKVIKKVEQNGKFKLPTFALQA